MVWNKLSSEERDARHQARLQRRYAAEREARAAKALAEGRPVGKSGPLPQFSEEELRQRQKESNRRSHEKHREERLQRRSERTKEARAALALKEGREPGRPGRPKIERSIEELREMRRIKAAKWREANRDKSRQICRESMMRTSHTEAVSEGREPGRIGRPAQFSADEKIEKHRARTRRYYHETLDASRERAARRARERRAEKKAGVYVSRQHPKLTAEQKRQQNVRMGQARRARLRAAIGDGYTEKDLQILRDRQKGLCNMLVCDQSLTPQNETLDHVFPLALGGTHEMGNFQLLCASCNSKKGAKHPSGFQYRYSLHCW